MTRLLLDTHLSLGQQSLPYVIEADQGRCLAGIEAADDGACDLPVELLKGVGLGVDRGGSCAGSDNGPEFIAQALRDWCEASSTTSTAYIEPGSTWENGFAESFNGRFREEFLNTELFTTAPQAQILADRWRWEYNSLRPHSALQGRTPLEAAQEEAAA